jgi:hypothetical protein
MTVGNKIKFGFEMISTDWPIRLYIDALEIK